MPDYAIIDPALTHSLSPRQVALSGADALCQAIESLWSIHATDESKAYANEALSLILGSLKEVTVNPTPVSRSAMARGAHLAGKAINISKTTACHAMSYALTVRFNIPHGQAVALTLPQLLIFNAGVSTGDVVDIRGMEYVQDILAKISDHFKTKNAEEAAEGFSTLMKDIGLSIRLSDFGIHEQDIDALVEDMSIERAGNNPRRFTKADAGRILRTIL